MLRMYWPDQSVLDGTWKPPGIRLAPTGGVASDR